MRGTKGVIWVEYALNSLTIIPPSNGELTITRLNMAEQIVSGTFWFDAINDKGEKTEVREGRFDMKF